MDALKFLNMLSRAPSELRNADYSGPLNTGAQVVGELVSDNFARQEGSVGDTWLPHSPTTIKIHGPHPLLRLTWTMYAAATNPDDPKAKKLVSEREIVFGIDGTEIPYAITQQKGGGRIPQREFFYVRDQDVVHVSDAMTPGLKEILVTEVLV